MYVHVINFPLNEFNEFHEALLLPFLEAHDQKDISCNSCHERGRKH